MKCCFILIFLFGFFPVINTTSAPKPISEFNFSSSEANLKTFPIINSDINTNVIYLKKYFTKKKLGFVLWQLPPQTHSQQESYVLLMDGGKVCVIDGGVDGDAPYLRGFLAALGNEVEDWFISHPHPDHMGALNAILKEPNGLKIHTIYHSELSEAFIDQYEVGYNKKTAEFYKNLRNFDGKVVDVLKPGLMRNYGSSHIKILGVKNEELINYNNQCLVIKAWDNCKSVLFLNDLDKEAGDELLNGNYKNELNCDYLQMAHHGQNGVRKDFYRSIKFKACLWPTPLWLHDNDAGKGYNTYKWETIEIRNLMDSIGIKKNYWAYNGLCKIE